MPAFYTTAAVPGNRTRGTCKPILSQAVVMSCCEVSGEFVSEVNICGDNCNSRLISYTGNKTWPTK